MLGISCMLRSDLTAWAEQIYVRTWKQQPQNVYNLAAIAVAVLIVIISIRLGVTYLKYVSYSSSFHSLTVGLT
jgi:hypothetical protein